MPRGMRFGAPGRLVDVRPPGGEVAEDAARGLASSAPPPARDPVQYIHTAPTPRGPWVPVNGTQTDLARACDTPSPLVLRNGSMLMACGKSSRWSIWSAPEPSGPWVELAVRY